MLEILDRIASKFRAEKATAETNYWKLVTALADGRDVSPEDVKAALIEGGKTPDEHGLRQLEEDVTRRMARRELAAKVAAAKDATALREQIAAKLRVENQKFENAEQAFRQATTPLYEQNRRLDEIEAEGQSAADRLVSQCPYVLIVEKYAAAERAVDAARARQGELQSAVNAGAAAERALTRLDDEPDDQVRARIESRAKATVAKAAESAKLLADTDREIKKLETQLLRVRAELLVP